MDHDTIVDVFDAWSNTRGLAATVRCTHAVGVTILVGCGGEAGKHLLQLDLVDRKLVHGAPVWTADVLRDVAETYNGVRCLSPGAEGVARVLATRYDREAERLVLADPVGARALGDRLGVRGALATRTDRASRLALSSALVARALASPMSVLRSMQTDAATRRCAVLGALKAGRLLPEALETWLEVVSHDHEVRRA